MEQKITKEELFRESDALNAYITDALSIYSGLRKTELTGVNGFKYAARKKEDHTKIDENDFSTFFNQILVVDYLQKHNINIFAMSDEEKRNLQVDISEKISSSILSDDKTQVIVKSDDVTKDNIDYEFVLNTFNYDEIVAFEKFYDMAKKANIPYYISINSDFSFSFNDSIIIGCSKDNLEQTLDVLNEFVLKNADILLKPMKFVKNIGNVVGFREVSHENLSVYTEVYNALIKAIDDTLATYGQVPENDLDRYKKLDAFSLNDAKAMLIENLKQNLINSKLDLEHYGSFKKSEPVVQKDETVIRVPKPTVAFEETKDADSVESTVEVPEVDSNVLTNETEIPKVTFNETNADVLAQEPQDSINTAESENKEMDSTDKAIDDFLNSMMPNGAELKQESNQSIENNSSSITSQADSTITPESEPSSLTNEELDAILDNAAEIEQQKRAFNDRAKKYQSIVSESNFLNTKLIYNGEEISLLDYLDKIDVLNKIPVDATISTENGKKSGEEFIRECVIPYALNKTDNDLDSIMSAYGAKIVKEKTGILSRLFR